MAQPMSVDEREAKEAEEFRTGPLSVLTTSVKTNSQVQRSAEHISKETHWHTVYIPKNSPDVL